MGRVYIQPQSDKPQRKSLIASYQGFIEDAERYLDRSKVVRPASWTGQESSELGSDDPGENPQGVRVGLCTFLPRSKFAALANLPYLLTLAKSLSVVGLARFNLPTNFFPFCSVKTS
jgi:hypothetical protein